MLDMEVKRHTALLLGPGFAPGLAGLGLLWELERRGIEVGCVAGANTGAIAGAMWALGRDLKLAARVLGSLPWERFQVARDFGASDPLLNALSLLTQKARFADLDRRLIVVARELATGSTRLIETGSVGAALRATLGVPGLFEPISLAGPVMIDGGGALPEAAALVRERVGSAFPDLIEVYVRPPAEAVASGSAFPEHARRMALYASTSWPSTSDGGEALWIEEEPAGLLDFEAAEGWFEAGRRAAERLVSGAPPAAR